MEAKAVGRYLRVTPRKARYVLDTVRGKSANEALAMLKFIPNEAAKYVRQVVESAIANAEHNYAMDREALRITRAYVDQGPTIKRIQPRAMGRAFRILKRMSHITVVLDEDETLKMVTKPKPKRTARRGKESPEAAPAKPTAARDKASEPKAKPEKKAARKKSESKLAPPADGYVETAAAVETEVEATAPEVEETPAPAEEQKEE